MGEPRKYTNTLVMVDRELWHDFRKEFDLSGMEKREAFEQALRLWIKHRKKGDS